MDAETIAKGLSEAQRLYVKEGPHPHWTPTRRALIKQGLVVDKGGALTDLGLAVRAILKGE